MKRSDMLAFQGIGFGLLANTSGETFAQLCFGVTAILFFVQAIWAREEK